MEQPVWTQTVNGANKKLVLNVWLRCGSLWITTPVPLLVNEFDVRKCIAQESELGSCQSNLFLSWGYEQLQKSKDSLKACFKNVNILLSIHYCLPTFNIIIVEYQLFSPMPRTQYKLTGHWQKYGSYVVEALFNAISKYYSLSSWFWTYPRLQEVITSMSSWNITSYSK